MNDIESKIRERSYQSPSRARASISRSSLKAKDKSRLVTLVDAWENEGTVDHVVAGFPGPERASGAEVAVDAEMEGLEAELVDVATGVHARNGKSGPLTPAERKRVDDSLSFRPPEGRSLAEQRLVERREEELLGERLTVRAPVLRINLNAAVRVRLTMLGVAQLHEARDRVKVPADLLERQGVWETTLWELMSAFGSKFAMGETPIEAALIEVLDPRVPQ